MELDPAQKREILSSIQSLDVFAWCITCETLLVGASEHSSFWGGKVNDIAQLHRRGTNHEVYVGGMSDLKSNTGGI